MSGKTTVSRDEPDQPNYHKRLMLILLIYTLRWHVIKTNILYY